MISNKRLDQYFTEDICRDHLPSLWLKELERKKRAEEWRSHLAFDMNNAISVYYEKFFLNEKKLFPTKARFNTWKSGIKEQFGTFSRHVHAFPIRPNNL